MENPYYEIIALIKSLAATDGGGLFTAEIGVDAGGPAVLLEGEAADLPFWRPAGLEITQADSGTAVLCARCDRGVVILAKLAAL